MNEGSIHKFSRCAPATQTVEVSGGRHVLRLRHALGHLYFVENFAYNVVGRNVRRLSLVRKTDAVTQNVGCHLAYIFGYHIAAALDEGASARSQCQINARTGRSAKGNLVFEFLQFVLLGVASCKYNVGNVLLDTLVYIHLLN